MDFFPLRGRSPERCRLAVPAARVAACSTSRRATRQHLGGWTGRRRRGIARRVVRPFPASVAVRGTEGAG